MKIIKRSGMEVEFDRSKIIAAVKRANNSVVEGEKVSDEQVEKIAENVETICEGMNRALNVEEIQDLVENQIMNQKAFRLASNYITYRYKRALVRKSNSTDKQILSLLECNNEEVIQENSNKNPTVNSVQRDYMAGEVSKDITKRFLLPADKVDAHEHGLIQYHDADYIAQLEEKAKELDTYKQNEADFEQEKEKWYEDVVFSEDAPDISNYKEYYESIDAANAEVLYKQVVEQTLTDEKMDDYVKTYSSMKPKEAAAIFDTMTDNLQLVADILSNMDTQSRGDILGKMNSDTAAKVTEIMEPSE